MSRRMAVSQRTKDHLARWYGVQLLDNVQVLRGSFFGWLFGRFGQHAVTINKTVHLTPNAPELDSDAGVSLLGHECYHILQQTQMGRWPFLLSYAVRWRPAHVRQGWRHPMEAQAYQRGREVLDGLRQ